MKFILALTVIAMFLAGCNTVFDEDLSSENDGNQITAEGITLEWNIENEQLSITLSAATTGWLSVGFDPSVYMQDANIIIGSVNGTEVTIRDDFGDSQYSHVSDVSLGGTDDISGISGSEESDFTVISFTIPLDSGDEYDRVLIPGNTYPVILAIGTSDDLDSIHAVRTTVIIEL